MNFPPADFWLVSIFIMVLLVLLKVFEVVH